LGPVRTGGPWRVGLRHPLSPSALILSILLEDEAVATSANYFRYLTVGGRRYGHVLNPRAGTPAETALSVTVVAESAMRADGLATAALVLGTNGGLALMHRAGVEGIVVSRDEGKPGRLLAHITGGLIERVQVVDPTTCIEKG